jgi:hypothetical protein
MSGNTTPIMIALSLIVCSCGTSENGPQSDPDPSPKAVMQSSPEPRLKASSRSRSNTEIREYLVIRPDRRNPLIGMEYNRARRAILRRGWTPFKGECLQMGPDSCVGIPELDICSAEGLCVSKFKKPRRCLILTMIGGPPKIGKVGDAVVRDTSFEEFSCERIRSN